MEQPLEISVHELKALIDKGAFENRAARLVDVREKWEADICRIAGGDLMPLGAFASHAKTLDRDLPVYVYCHHGGRSMQATQWLRRNGYPNATNIAGGIHAWAEQIEPGMERY